MRLEILEPPITIFWHIPTNYPNLLLLGPLGLKSAMNTPHQFPTYYETTLFLLVQ